MSIVFYGPFARFADWYHGWRDGRGEVPPKPLRYTDPAPLITTAHREFLIRRAQDAFEHEHLGWEQGRADTVRRIAATTETTAAAQRAVTRVRAELPEASRALTEAELTKRRPGEERHDERIVRLRRARERLRRIRLVRDRIEAAYAVLAQARAQLSALERQAEQWRDTRYQRVVRIHAYTHRRLAAYRRRLVRSHPFPAWVNEVMSPVDPAIPGWALPPPIPVPEPGPVAPPKEHDPQPITPKVIPLGARTTFGAGSAKQVVDEQVTGYAIAPLQFTITRRGNGFRLRVHGSSPRGPFVAGRHIQAGSFKPGHQFDFADWRYEFLTDGSGLKVTPIGRAQLVVSHLDGPPRKQLKRNQKRRLTDMSVVQREGTVLAILGPSGAGKTSLFKALMGELGTEGGSLFFRTLDLAREAAQIRTMLGFVPQENHLYRVLTVQRLLTYADRLRTPPDARKESRGDRLARINRICAGLNLEQQQHQLVTTLSGGQLKRVSIALEMLSSPRLLMLDEPTSGLDAGMDREVMRILNTYATTALPPEPSGRVAAVSTEDGSPVPRDELPTVIIITHTTEHLDLADQVLVVAKEGRPIFFGHPRDELVALGTENYADFMRALDDEATITRLAGEYVRGPAAADAAAEAGRLGHGAPGRRANEPRVRGRRLAPFRNQLRVLVRRQLALVLARGATKNRRDRGLADWLKGISAVVLPYVVAAGGAALAGVVSGADGLGAASVAGFGNSAANAALSLLITLCVLTGQALTYSDVVNEYEIIRREFRTGASTLAVMTSKWLVFAVAAVIQSALVTVIYTEVRPGPATSAVLPPRLELAVDLAATSVTAMSLGLLISVLARKLEQAVALATLTAILQVALNGVPSHLAEHWWLNAVSWLLPARWGLAATASTTDLKGIFPGAHPDSLWDPTTPQWLFNLGLLGLLSLGSFGLATWLLRRRMAAPE